MHGWTGGMPIGDRARSAGLEDPALRVQLEERPRLHHPARQASRADGRLGLNPTLLAMLRVVGVAFCVAVCEALYYFFNIYLYSYLYIL